MKKLLVFFFIFTMLLSVGCQNHTQPTSTPTETAVATESTDTHTPEVSPTPTSVTEPASTPTPKPTKTPDSQFVPGANTFGPYTFGANRYYLYIESVTPGSEIALIDPQNGKKVFSQDHHGMHNFELTRLTASIIDLNFDGIPDFSYIKDKTGRRECWLATGFFDQNGDVNITSYTYHETLSMIPSLTRCFESSTIYGLDYQGTSAVIGYKYKSDFKTLQKNEELTEVFTWNVDKVASALAGKGASVVESEEHAIRGVDCKSVVVGGYLTIARDDYGNYYLKDMPTGGFYRLALNPNGNWSKSERVTLGS